MIFDWLLGLFSVDMGIDLGTANTLVYVRGEGIVMSEPSVVAVYRGTNVVLDNGNAVGNAAKEMLGKTPGSITAVRPLKDGVIADFDITEAMLRYFIRKVHKRSWGYKPRVLIAVPSGITAVEYRAVRNSAERAGGREVYLVAEPRAASLGCGMPITEPVASMIVDVGGGTSEVAVISLANEVTSESIRVGGDEMDQAIINHLKKNYNLAIGLQTAERVKIEIGSAAPLESERTAEVKGRDLIAGLPRKVVVSSEEIREAMGEPISAIVDAVRLTLERTPEELAADIVDRGMVLTGGGALLRGIDKVLAESTGVEVHLDDDPLTSVARGTGVFLENLDTFKKYLRTDQHAV